LALVHGADALPALHGAAFGHPAVAAAEAVVILTGEWFRNSWRYRERGYRRALLDTGHVLGNLVEVAPLDGFDAVPLASFRDAVVADASSQPTSWTDADTGADTIAARRSTRSFRREAVPKAALLRVLAHAYPSPAPHLFAPELLETYVVASDVTGLRPGTYVY